MLSLLLKILQRVRFWVLIVVTILGNAMCNLGPGLLASLEVVNLAAYIATIVVGGTLVVVGLTSVLLKMFNPELR